MLQETTNGQYSETDYASSYHHMLFFLYHSPTYVSASEVVSLILTSLTKMCISQPLLICYILHPSQTPGKQNSSWNSLHSLLQPYVNSTVLYPNNVSSIHQHQKTNAQLKQLTSCGSLPLSNREIFFSFMSDQKMVPVCILEAVATTFSTIIGTLSSPCSLRSATKMEWRFEMIRKAALWSKERTGNNLPASSQVLKETKGNIYFIHLQLWAGMA